jgi:hypothetical protein
VTQYPEEPVMEPQGRRVLDPRFRGDDNWAGVSGDVQIGDNQKESAKPRWPLKHSIPEHLRK